MRGSTIRIPALLGAGIAMCACGQVRPEAAPYRFGQTLLSDWAPRRAARPAARPARRPAPASRPAPAPPEAPREAWREDAARRGRELVGAPFPGSAPAATAALLAAVFGGGSAWDAPQPRARRRTPRPGDLVLFAASPPAERKLGVVLSCDGPRVVFLHLRGGKAQLGWLHLAQPNRRRLPGDARVANSYVRVKRPEDPPRTRYLAGQLLAGFAAPARSVTPAVSATDARSDHRYGAR